jgi:hypothetical protein
VLVSVGRKGPGSRCRFAQANGRLGRPVSCARTAYLRARGTTTWRFRYAHRLPAGRYFAWARAVDVAGNVERKSRRRNLTAFRVR